MKLSFIMGAILQRTSQSLNALPDAAIEVFENTPALLEAVYDRCALGLIQELSAEERQVTPHLRVVGVNMRITQNDDGESDTIAPMWRLAFHNGPKFRLLDMDEATPYWQDEEADYYLTSTGFLAVYGNGAADVTPLLSSKHDEIIDAIDGYLALEIGEDEAETFTAWFNELFKRRRQRIEANQALKVPGGEPLTKEELKERLTNDSVAE